VRLGTRPGSGRWVRWTTSYAYLSLCRLQGAGQVTNCRLLDEMARLGKDQTLSCAASAVRRRSPTTREEAYRLYREPAESFMAAACTSNPRFFRRCAVAY